MKKLREYSFPPSIYICLIQACHYGAQKKRALVSAGKTSLDLYLL